MNASHVQVDKVRVHANVERRVGAGVGARSQVAELKGEVQ